MSYYICKGAQLQCSMGSSPGQLIVVPKGTLNYLHGELMANIMDYKPLVNIQPFGMCKSMANPTVAAATAANFGRLQPMPCQPNTVTPWTPGKSNVLESKNPALMDDCKLACAWAGVISVNETGQK